MRERRRDGRWTAALVVALLAVSASSQQYSRTIVVDPERGNNTEGCLTSPDLPCRNLSYAFQYQASSTCYLLLPGTHYLNTTTSFTDLTDIAVTGNASGAADIVCFARNSGLAFVNVTNVSLQNVSFSGCSSLRNSTSLQNVFVVSSPLASVLVGLYFSRCENVRFSSVKVTRSPNATGVVVYNTVGTNSFTDCVFSENVNHFPELGGGGGGVYVEFSYCLPGDESCLNGTAESYTAHNQNSSYTFENCVFRDNYATNKNPKSGGTTYILPHRQIHEAFGRGGGLSFFFKANATRNEVAVKNCIFSENTALWGGGLFAEFHDTTSGNGLSVIGCAFEGNHLLSGVGTAGGGIRIALYVFVDGVTEKGNSIVLESCNFSSNSAVSGGGISFSPAGQRTSGEIASLSLTNCSFLNNFAGLGLAVHLAQFALTTGAVPRVTITNLLVQASNYLSYADPTKAYQIRGGALYTNQVGVDFLDHVEFSHNQASALIIAGADASFQNCSGNFCSNEGLKGGAMLLLGDAFFTVNESTTMLFLNNTAKWGGGAIYKQYIDRDNFPEDPHCFIRHANPFLSPDDWRSTFHFIDNNDRQGKIAIHATSLYPCVWAGGKSIGDVSDVFCWKNWFYNNRTKQTEHCRKYLSSFAGNITYQYSIERFPGIEVDLPIFAKDDLNRTREVSFHAFSLDTDTAVIDDAFQYVASNTIKFTGKEGAWFILELDSTTQRVWHLEMNVTILPCPPGYTPTNQSNQSSCSCTDDAFEGYLICSEDDYSASLNGRHWMGVLNNRTLVGNCPPQYCLTVPHRKYNPLPQNFSQLDSHICGQRKRTGVLCGECVSGHGPAINSRSKRFDCVPCENANLAKRITLYILLQYLPLFLLFLAIIVFNIKLTTGSANAFILFSQVVSSTFDLSADGQIPLDKTVPHPQYLLLAYQLPYGVFNLGFFEQWVKPFCLSSEFNVLDVLVLDYVAGFFPLAMILMVIFYLKVKGCCQEKGCRVRFLATCQRVFPRIGDSIIPAFASFLLLSYSKFILTSSYIISQHSLIDDDGDFSETRVYYAGQYSSDDSEYVLRYMIPAIAILVLLGSLPPLLLLHYPLNWFEACLGRVWWLKRHYPSAKVHIFLDAFQGCFRPRMRFFAGFYFIFRLIIDLSYTLSRSWVEHYVTQTIVCVVFIFLLAICRPYTAEYHLFNFVDAAMFANLAVVTVLGLYMYSTTHINPYQNPSPVAFWLQYFLVFLPLFGMLGYVLWRYAVPRAVLLCHRLAGNIEHHEPAASVDSSLLVNGRASGAWNIFSGSVSFPGRGGGGGRHRRRLQQSIEESVDWQRATLKNTYRRSPTSRPLLDPAEGDEEEEGDGGGSTQSQRLIKGVHSSLLPTSSSSCVTATYGTHATTTTTSHTGTTTTTSHTGTTTTTSHTGTTTTTGTDGSSDVAHRTSITQGQPPTQNESNE